MSPVIIIKCAWKVISHTSFHPCKAVVGRPTEIWSCLTIFATLAYTTPSEMTYTISVRFETSLKNFSCVRELKLSQVEYAEVTSKQSKKYISKVSVGFVKRCKWRIACHRPTLDCLRCGWPLSPLSLWRHNYTNVCLRCQFYYRATRMHSEDYAVARCLSVCLSVTRRYCVSTVIHILKVFSASGSPTILGFLRQTGWQYSNGDPPNGGAECKGQG